MAIQVIPYTRGRLRLLFPAEPPDDLKWYIQQNGYGIWSWGKNHFSDEVEYPYYAVIDPDEGFPRGPAAMDQVKELIARFEFPQGFRFEPQRASTPCSTSLTDPFETDAIELESPTEGGAIAVSEDTVDEIVERSAAAIQTAIENTIQRTVASVNGRIQNLEDQLRSINLAQKDAYRDLAASVSAHVENLNEVIQERDQRIIELLLNVEGKTRDQLRVELESIVLEDFNTSIATVTQDRDRKDEQLKQQELVNRSLTNEIVNLRDRLTAANQEVASIQRELRAWSGSEDGSSTRKPPQNYGLTLDHLLQNLTFSPSAKDFILSLRGNENIGRMELLLGRLNHEPQNCVDSVFTRDGHETFFDCHFKLNRDQDYRLYWLWYDNKVLVMNISPKKDQDRISEKLFGMSRKTSV